MVNEEDKFYTIPEVAELLKVSERSINRYIKSGKLKASKIGWWRIKKTDLDEFLNKTSNLSKINKKI